VECERQADEIVARQMARRLEALRQVGKVRAAAGQVMRFAEDPDRPGLRGDQHPDRLQEAGLAGAVPTDQAERLALPHRERDVLERRRRAVAHGEPFDRDRIRGRGGRGGGGHGPRGHCARGHGRRGPGPGAATGARAPGNAAL
jgi:chorismate mutase